LATSREALGITGEAVYRVPSLLLPEAGEILTPASISHFEAVHLFKDRARFASPGFEIMDSNATALVSICRQLDGIPLAIELAAARVRSLPVHQIDARLNDRFRLLTGGSRAALPRQQTLRALIDWSVELLNASEKAMLARLSVFSGGWYLEAAEKICSGDEIEEWEILDLITSLVDKSLVVYEDRDTAGRYRQLETVRQYSADLLQESGTSGKYRLRHFEYFLSMAEQSDAKLDGPEQGNCLSRLETERDNLNKAIAFSLEELGGGDMALRLGSALQQFWWMRGHMSEGRECLEALLAKPASQLRSTARANALNGAGILARMQGDYTDARKLLSENLEIRRELDDLRGAAGALHNLSTVASEQGSYSEAYALLEQALALNRQLGNRQWEANNLIGLGNRAYDQGDMSDARSHWEAALAIYRECDNIRGIALVLGNLANEAAARRETDQAREMQMESLALRRQLEDKWGVALSLANLGNLELDLLNFQTARTMHRESLSIRREIGERRGIAESLDLLARLNFKEGRFRTAAELWAAGDNVREGINTPLPPFEKEERDRDIADARLHIGDDAFSAAWSEGRSRTLEQSIDIALGE